MYYYRNHFWYFLMGLRAKDSFELATICLQCYTGNSLCELVLTSLPSTLKGIMIQLQTVTHKLSISIALIYLQFSKSMPLFGVLYNMASMLFCKLSICTVWLVYPYLPWWDVQDEWLFVLRNKKWCISYITGGGQKLCIGPWTSGRRDVSGWSSARRSGPPLTQTSGFNPYIVMWGDLAFGSIRLSVHLFVWTEPSVLDNIFWPMFIKCIG